MTKREEAGKRNLFREMSTGVQAMRDHRKGRLELRSHKVELPMAYQLKVTLMESDPRGERACPPEDCGGVHGYYGTLEILRNPRHDEYKHTKTWIESMTGGPFDPDAFDIEAVNAALKALR